MEIWQFSKLTYIICILIISSYNLFGQSVILDKANNHYEHLEYTLAAPLFQEAINQKMTSDIDIHLKLVDCFTKMKQPEEAMKVLEWLIARNPGKKNIYIKYGRLLKKTGEYSKAIVVFKRVLQLDPKDMQIVEEIQSCNNAKNLILARNSIYVKNLELNCSNNDFSPFPFGNGLIFSSSRTQKRKEKTYYWDGQPYIDLYYASKTIEGRFEEPTLLPKPINSEMHEGPLTYDEITQTLYFTRNDLSYKKKKGKSTSLLKIYTSIKNGEEWENPIEFTYNSKEFSTGHPSLSPNGELLFFISDMPGGEGKSDIYFCRKNGSSWTTPINLGPKINTPEAELFPTIVNDTLLYFSSEGRGGLGGLDIYKAVLKGSLVKSVTNLGAPFNSPKDDFGIVFEDYENSVGYFSSNRKNGKGGDDIYLFKKMEVKIQGLVLDSLKYTPLSNLQVRARDKNGFTNDFYTNEQGAFELNLLPEEKLILIFSAEGYLTKQINISTMGIQSDKDTSLIVEMVKGVSPILEGQALDKDGNTPISKAQVTRIDLSDNSVEITKTNDQGQFQFALDKEKQYEIIIDKENHFIEKKQFETEKFPKEAKLNSEVKLAKMKINDILEIENIYYEFNKFEITPAAIITLDKVVQILKDNPTLTLELSSHTDIRGDEFYNYTLSEKRALSALHYLTKHNIERYRLTYKVYGESQLAIDCEGDDCDEKKHQLNRRTEFKITGF
ncbi:OmpA family protein [Flexithrix dorotheae]|uniref:OmpA family protein n=1 Tax=Flexithrix dorotheae TaxID=70993 RepID=UPI0003774A2A|nr:OmpA family protein [Flexithrix dorotheae]